MYTQESGEEREVYERERLRESGEWRKGRKKERVTEERERKAARAAVFPTCCGSQAAMREAFAGLQNVYNVKYSYELNGKGPFVTCPLCTVPGQT